MHTTMPHDVPSLAFVRRTQLNASVSDTLEWEDQGFLSHAGFHGSSNMEGKKEGLLPQPTSYCKLLPTPAVHCELQTSITSGPATTWQRRRRCLPLMRIGPLGKHSPVESHPGLIWKGDSANISRRQCDKALVLLRFGAPWWWRASLNTTNVQRPRLVKVLSRLGTMGVLYKSASASLSSRDPDWYPSTFNGSPGVTQSLVLAAPKLLPR